MEKQNVVRQACIHGMGRDYFPLGDFTEEVEWMNWMLEDLQGWGSAVMRQGTEVVKVCLRHFSVSKRIEVTKCAKDF